MYCIVFFFKFQLGASTSVPFTKVLSNLLLTVILPLIFGQMFRNHLTQTLMKTLQSKISVTGQSCLILIIFSTFCDTFDSTTTEHFNASVILLNICLGKFHDTALAAKDSLKRLL